MSSEHNPSLYQNLSLEEREHSEIEIRGEIPVETALRFRAPALKHLGQHATVPGFRKGHVPQNLLVSRLGEQALWEEMAKQALNEAFPEIVRDKKLTLLGEPHITITKLAPGNPIAFKIEAAVAPTITLPDYRALAREIAREPLPSFEVSGEEVERTANELLEHMPKEEGRLAELTDEVVKKLGKFENVADFKTKLKGQMRADKERKEHERRRLAIADKVVGSAIIPLPRVIVEHELNRLLAQFKHDVERMGLTYKEYLQKINKTEEDLRSEWRADAEKRAKLELILAEIATKESIAPTEEDVKKESGHLLSHMKNTDPARVETHVRNLLRNEKVFEFLEGQGI